MSALSELSILIVTWNGDELLKNCLDSVRRACDTEPEIVVVDNANLESTKALVATHPNAQYIAAPENLGFAGGNNLGLPLCTRPYVLLLNNDTIVHEEPFTQLIQYLKDHPKVAVVQGKMKLPLQGDVLDACGFMLNGAGMVDGRFMFQPSDTTATPTMPVYAAKGACLLFKQSVLSKIAGPLFHDFFMNNGEETDFCYRVWIAGYEVHFVNTPMIDHLNSQTVSRINASRVIARNLSNTLFSHLTTLGPYGMARVLPGFFLYQTIVAMRFLSVFNYTQARPYIKYLTLTFKRFKLIREVRNKIQQRRIESDKNILRKILTHPPISRYYYEMRGSLIDRIKNGEYTYL